MRRMVLVLSLLVLVAPLSLARPADQLDPATVMDGLDLHQRLGRGAVVVIATVDAIKGKAYLRVEEVLRGDEASLPKRMAVAYRGVNRGRKVGEDPFDTKVGERAVFILEAWTDSWGESRNVELFRPEGLAKARIPLPREGAEALLEAVRRIVDYDDSPRRALAEARLVEWLSGENRWLIDVALSDAARYSLATADWIPGLLKRSRDVSSARRLLALQAMGEAFSRGRLGGPDNVHQEGDGGGMAQSVRDALIQHARADEAFEVRRICVEYLPALGVADLAALLGSIAQDDPHQDVRFAASVALAELRR